MGRKIPWSDPDDNNEINCCAVSRAVNATNNDAENAYDNHVRADNNNNNNNSNHSKEETVVNVDVVVIGSGIGGLSCAALCSKYGLQTLCVEAHRIPGGCAKSFSRYTSASKTVPFRFDSGPSFLAGLSKKGTNPLRQLLDAIDVADEIPWYSYNGWLIHDTADGQTLEVVTGNHGEFEANIEAKAGKESREAFEAFNKKILCKRGLSTAAGVVPPMALRGGASAFASMTRYMTKLMTICPKAPMLIGPFSKVMDAYKLKDPFIRKWYDYLSVTIGGQDASHTQAAPIAYMSEYLHTPNAILDYPMGGMNTLIQALIKGLRKHGGDIWVNSRVERMILEEDKSGTPHCKGVILSDGRIITARKAVVCNANAWNLVQLLENSMDPSQQQQHHHHRNNKKRTTEDKERNNKSKNNNNDDNNDDDDNNSNIKKAVESIREDCDNMNVADSFMHLYLGIPKDGIEDSIKHVHHTVLNFNKPIQAGPNVISISIPTVCDPNLAPEGYHVIHAFMAGTRYDDWLPFVEEEEEEHQQEHPHPHQHQHIKENKKERKKTFKKKRKAKNNNGNQYSNKYYTNNHSPECPSAYKYSKADGYNTMKEKKVECCWTALEHVIPDIRQRAQRPGSFVAIGTPLTHERYNMRHHGAYGFASPNGKDICNLPGSRTKIKGLFTCGDCNFPGIGLPAVAGSGTIAANSLVSIKQQKELMNQLRKAGAIQ